MPNTDEPPRDGWLLTNSLRDENGKASAGRFALYAAVVAHLYMIRAAVNGKPIAEAAWGANEILFWLTIGTAAARAGLDKLDKLRPAK